MSSSDRVSSRPSPDPVGHQSECSACHGPVDPLRAARVRIIDDRFHYFCSASCATSFQPQTREHNTGPTLSNPSSATETAPHALPAKESPRPPLTKSVEPTRVENAALRTPVSPHVAAEETPVSPVTSSAKVKSDAAPRRSSFTPQLGINPALTAERERQTKERTRLLLVAMASSGLSLLLLLAIEGEMTNWLRAVLLDVSLACVVMYALKAKVRRELALGVSTVGSVVIAALIIGVAQLGLVTASAAALGWLGLAGTQLGYLSVVLYSLERKCGALHDAFEQIGHAFEGSVLRLTGAETTRIPVSELRPGEEIVVHAGEVLPVDASIIAGSAEVHPWWGTDRVREIGPEDFLYAGTRLTSGQLRAVVRWNGNDRHWLRLTHDSNRMAHLHAPSVSTARKWETHVAPALVAVTSLIAWFQAPSQALLAAFATASILLNPAAFRLIQTEVMRVVLTSLEHGIVIASAAVIEVASRVSAAVFCARGTLLLGEPELSFLRPMGDVDAQTLLALAAGAEQVSPHPIANSVLRAARAQNVVADAVRNPRSEPGLGVTALSSDGRALIVGSRALMLRERISVARAEEQITELEATGRTVLLVALDGHLAGILAFQDGLRAGARASIQHLLDAGIEPVLLSGDSRETCEALAKTIDVEHVRPDVLPSERGKEIERLRGGGGVVAVVGRSPTDDLALSTATVAIALPGRGSQAGSFDIELASDEVQSAALALNLLARHRKRVQRIQSIMFGGAVLMAFATVALAIPAGFLPLGGLLLFGLTHVFASPATAGSTPR